MSLSGRNTQLLLESGWKFGFKLKAEHIWDVFVILTLLRYAVKETVQPVMTDGLYMGHPCCAVPSCRDSLANNRHRFCPVHFENHYICAVRGCLEAVLPPGKMCANPQHRQMEKLNKA